MPFSVICGCLGSSAFWYITIPVEEPSTASERDKAVCDELGVNTRQFRRWRDELALLAKEAFPGTSANL